MFIHDSSHGKNMGNEDALYFINVNLHFFGGLIPLINFRGLKLPQVFRFLRLYTHIDTYNGYQLINSLIRAYYLSYGVIIKGACKWLFYISFSLYEDKLLPQGNSITKVAILAKYY